MAVGFLTAFWNASRRASREGFSAESITSLAPWLIGGAILGARTLYVITYWKQEFAGQPLLEIFKIRSGLVFYGGLIGASLGTILFARRHKLNLWRLADVMAPSIALGHAFGRLGCLMTGCCYGRPCQWPWGIQFPEGHATAGGKVHPTQIYEACLNFLLFMALSWFYPKKRFDGHIFAIYLIAYASFRAVVEMFRGDYPHYSYGFITPAQWVSSGLFAVGWALFCIRSRGSVTALPKIGA